MISPKAKLVAGVSFTQTLAWASSYYLLAILAEAMARDVGASASTIFSALSVAILISGAVGPLAGRLIDRTGGRAVLAASNVLLAAGLVLLSQAHGIAAVFAAWTIIGAGMGRGLYEAAFACVTRFHGADSRKLITTITLVAGFASTVGWPLTALFEAWWSWRGACLAWAAVHVFLALPVNLWSVPVLGRVEEGAAPAPAGEAAPVARLALLLVGAFFCLEWFISTSMAVHLPRVLEQQGLSREGAIAAASLVGPAQVAARFVEITLLQRLRPAAVSVLASAAHPTGVAALFALGAAAAPLFTIVHGAGNGLFTIARGTLPLALFGPRDYGLRLNLLMVPGRITQAASPFLFGLAVDHLSSRALLVTALLGLAATFITAHLCRGHLAHAPQAS
jgi:MFS family permease